jgi:hypothetical protein
MQKWEGRLSGVNWAGVVIIVGIIMRERLLLLIMVTLVVILRLLLLLAVPARVERHKILGSLCESIFVVVLLCLGVLGIHGPFA